jgi:hypothetical protein
VSPTFQSAGQAFERFHPARFQHFHPQSFSAFIPAGCVSGRGRNELRFLRCLLFHSPFVRKTPDNLSAPFLQTFQDLSIWPVCGDASRLRHAFEAKDKIRDCQLSRVCLDAEDSASRPAWLLVHEHGVKPGSSGERYSWQ